jgi:hypothetical protein
MNLTRSLLALVLLPVLYAVPFAPPAASHAMSLLPLAAN